MTTTATYGRIVIQNVSFAPAPTAAEDVTISYRGVGDLPDKNTPVGTFQTADGYFRPPVVIDMLDPTKAYIVRFETCGCIYEQIMYPGVFANQPPVCSTDVDWVLQLPANSVQFAGAASDPEGSPVVVKWTEESGNTHYTIDDPSILTPTVSNLALGNYLFRMTVTDNLGATCTCDVHVTVQAANQPPVCYAGPDASLALPGSFTVSQATASDPDGGTATISWTASVAPGTYQITNGNTLTPTFSNLQPGVYTFRMTATDKQLSSCHDEMQLTVTAAVCNISIPGLKATFESDGKFHLTYSPPSETLNSFLLDYSLDNGTTYQAVGSYSWNSFQRTIVVLSTLDGGVNTLFRLTPACVNGAAGPAVVASYTPNFHLSSTSTNSIHYKVMYGSGAPDIPLTEGNYTGGDVNLHLAAIPFAGPVNIQLTLSAFSTGQTHIISASMVVGGNPVLPPILGTTTAYWTGINGNDIIISFITG